MSGGFPAQSPMRRLRDCMSNTASDSRHLECGDLSPLCLVAAVSHRARVRRWLPHDGTKKSDDQSSPLGVRRLVAAFFSFAAVTIRRRSVRDLTYRQGPQGKR